MSFEVRDETQKLIQSKSPQWTALADEIAKRIVGQKDIIEKLCIGLLCNGHILLEGVPGLAKTTLIKTLAQGLGVEFSRIQFTPDLLPSDLVGTLIYNPKTQEFDTKKGPVFSNIILADEINRAPSKVQAALLEAMQEHQVTIGENTYKLEQPFLVLATQNPIEQEGTYRLPEAQVDRFMFKEIVGYPSRNEELEILEKVFNPKTVNTVLSREDIAASRKIVDQIYVDDKVKDYIVSIVLATRTPKEAGLEDLTGVIDCGASPRATLTMHHAARAHAFLQGRSFVTPDDVKAIAPASLRHRISLTYEAQADNITTDDVIERILDGIPSP